MDKKNEMKNIIESYQKLMNSTKKVLWTNRGFEEYEVGSTWNDPLEEVELNEFFQSRSWYIPPDYLEFLKLCNGGVLFAHPYAGGGTQLLDVRRIERLHQEINLPEYWIPIIWTDGIIGSICMDTDRAKAHKYPYLYFLDAMDRPDEAIPIYCDFTTLLIRLIETQGQEFWLWEKYDKIKFK